MITAIYKKLLTTMMLITLASSVGAVQGLQQPSSKYQHQGQITAVDKAKRLLTIETRVFKGNKTRTFLELNQKTYSVAVGVKLGNLPKSMQYSGIKNLPVGALVSFNLKQGTEKKKNPRITEMWVELQ